MNNKMIKKVVFWGSSYVYSFIEDGLKDIDYIELSQVFENPMEVDTDLLILGYSLPNYDIELLKRERIPGKGPKSVVSIAHGPYPQNGQPSPDDISSDFFHFQWVSDVSLVHWIIKLVENHLYADFYFKNQHKRFLLLLEDEIRFASYFIPLIIKEIELRTLSLLPLGTNKTEGNLKAQTDTPVLLLASNYEQAMKYIDSYSDRMVGVISSLGFPVNHNNNLNAGFDLIDKIRTLKNEIPLIIQTSQETKKEHIIKSGALYMDKNNPDLLEDLRKHLLDYFGFGDFIFRMPDSNYTVVAKASNLAELKECIKWIPEKSFLYHASRYHFSNWLGVHGYLKSAETIRPFKPTNVSDARNQLIYYLDELK